MIDNPERLQRVDQVGQKSIFLQGVPINRTVRTVRPIWLG
jgi:hypothetical protein